MLAFEPRAKFLSQVTLNEIAAYNRQAPGIWDAIEKMRGMRREVPAWARHMQSAQHMNEKDLIEMFWPKWCFLPYILAEHSAEIAKLNIPDAPYAVGLDSKTRATYRSRLMAAICLAAWRQTQGIYMPHPALLRELWDSPISGKIPTEIITRLPEWSVLLPVPEGAFKEAIGDGPAVAGVLASLTMLGQHKTLIFRLLYADSDMSGLLALPLKEELEESVSMVLDSVSAMEKEHHGDKTLLDMADFARTVYTSCTHDVGGLLSTLLYLCSEEREVSTVVKPVAPVKTKHGIRIFPPSMPTVVHVGLRVGAALERAGLGKPKMPDGIEAISGTHASPRPHVRRAHWHLYHTGVGRLMPRVNWIPPIIINAGFGEVDPTARPVVEALR